MKTKTQKKEELKRGGELLEKSRALVFSDFTNVPTKDLNRLRRELKAIGGNLLVLKKRLLGLLLKERGVAMDVKQFKMPTLTIFSKSDVEEISGPVFKFFSSLEVAEGKEKNMWLNHILGAYDLSEKKFIDAKQVMVLGKLPSREIMLAQTLGMIAAPIRSFLYLLKQKAASPSAEPQTASATEPSTASPTPETK